MVDCYSLGKIFLQCVFLLSDSELAPMRSNDPNYLENVNKYLQRIENDVFRSLLSRMLSNDRKERPQIKEVMEGLQCLRDKNTVVQECKQI